MKMVDLLNKKIKHKTLGTGTVIAQDDNYITIEFSSKTSKFSYPAAFEKFLVPEEAAVLEAIDAETSAAKEAKEAAKAAEMAKKAAEEAARLEALKHQTETKETKKSGSAKAYTPVKRTSGQALTYLVFQGDTFDEECKGQFIWAPKYTKRGGTCHHWDRLMDVREGDVIFHCSNGYIQAVSKAKAACVDSARPDHAAGDWTQWEKDGRRVDCDYTVLKKPLKHGAYKDTILEYCGVKYAPFDRDGNGNMGYLFDLNKDLASFFIKEIAKNNPGVIDLEYLKFLLV